MNWENIKEGGILHRLNIAKNDIRYYGKKKRYVALGRVLWNVLVLRHYSESCEVCGRRYFSTVWVASTELYRSVHGNNHGQMCPACFTNLGRSKGIKVFWAALPDDDNYEAFGLVMDGFLDEALTKELLK